MVAFGPSRTFTSVFVYVVDWFAFSVSRLSVPVVVLGVNSWDPFLIMKTPYREVVFFFRIRVFFCVASGRYFLDMCRTCVV